MHTLPQIDKIWSYVIDYHTTLHYINRDQKDKKDKTSKKDNMKRVSTVNPHNAI
jgi:hypothetical protein